MISCKHIYIVLLATCYTLSLLPAPSAPHTTITPSSTAESPTTPTKKNGKKKRKPKKKRESKSQKERHTLNTMTYEELKEAKDRYLKNNDKPTALKFLAKMVPKCDDLKELHVIMLELADLHYTLGEFEDAGTVYQEFIKLYPGSEKVEYATYKALVCSFDQIRDADRDQSKTKDTLELANTFLNRSVFVTHRKQVQEIATKCQQRLLDSDISVINFYLNRGSNNAAQKRLAQVRENFIAPLPASEATILALEANVAQAQNDLKLAENKRLELALKFPTQSAALAPQPVKLANRF
jgi:outer membrane assembly lipoprotein YfiO